MRPEASCLAGTLTVTASACGSRAAALRSRFDSDLVALLLFRPHLTAAATSALPKMVTGPLRAAAGHSPLTEEHRLISQWKEEASFWPSFATGSVSRLHQCP